ncbi:arylsulfatase [Rubritalea spongiae]
MALSYSGFGADEKPNIIFIFADDMGVGDVSHMGGKAPTPALDRMAKEGLRFTDAHTTSSVCTPSRYGVLTGRYNWRTRLQRSVFLSPHDKPLIKENESTVASLLKENGYNTACIGKWHLGIGWQFKEGSTPKDKTGHDIDFTKPAVTPTANGFEYFFGIQASLDMPPFVYIENEMAVADATATKQWKRKGAADPDFEADQCLIDFAEKSVEYINEKSKEDKPFFMYIPLTSPHAPIVPSEAWKGKSEIGEYGDFLMETDWVVGQVLEALEKNGIYENTLVMFSTDNGCSPVADIESLTKQGHKPNGDLRGMKSDIYEGGHRVPTLALWPKVIKGGATTDRITSLSDFYATCAEIAEAEVKPSDGVDSVSFYETLKDPTKVERDAIVMHSISGDFAIRKGKWKLCFCSGSGGWTKPRKAPAGEPKWQLFDLDADPTEQKNLYQENPEVVNELHELMLGYIENGRSTPGAKQENDVPVKFVGLAGKKGSTK